MSPDEAEVVVAVSHKGGVGRTTTTANVAYRLALGGNRVCVVDLDLASPTLGSILAVEEQQTGVQDGWGIHSFFPSDPTRDDELPALGPEALREKKGLLLDVYAVCGDQRVTSELKHVFDDLAECHFKVLLGENREHFATPSPSMIKKYLTPLIAQLRRDFDYVFIDVRSGIDSPMRGLLNSSQRLKWMVCYRWTPQHVHAAADLVLTLRNSSVDPDRIRMVRVAAPEETMFQGPNGAWLKAQSQATEKLAESIPTFKNSDGSGCDPLRGGPYGEAVVPRSDVLTLREGIVSGYGDSTLEAATTGLVQSYRDIARLLFGDDVPLDA